MILHPGASAALRRLDANEYGIAVMMKEGELSSPQVYHNVTLFNIRITGTGVSYRPTYDEYVYRKPENYLTPEFLARINGLPVIMMHPAKALLNSKEFANRIVGTVFLPFIRGDEVWAVCKIYDDETIKLLQTEKLSTSPSVLVAGTKLKFDDGSRLLVEDDPTIVDHIAICQHGVWDKGDEPSGIEQSQIVGDMAMADEDKKEEKKEEKKDDAASKRADDEKFDIMLKGIKDACEKMDALGKRMDEFESKDKEEEKKKDAASKADDDDDDDKRKDAEEPEEEKGKAKELVADNKKKDSKRKDEDHDTDVMRGDKVKADKAKADDDDDDKRKDDDDDDAKKRKDDDDDDKRKDRADSVDLRAIIAKQQKELDRLSNVMKGPSDAEFASISKAQAKADDVYIAHGGRAPRPLFGETTIQYRRRIADDLRKFSSYKEFNLGVLSAEKDFSQIEDQIYSDAMTAARMPSDLPEGRVRMTERNVNGHVYREFHGGKGSHFVHQFTRSQRAKIKSPADIARGF